MLQCVLCVALVALVAASDGGYEKKETKQVTYYQTNAHSYHGRYGGQCSNDGFYYNNADSFVICSNGNAYYQNCAPGSRNSGYNNYNYGNQYHYRDFCDVNLVDYGYGAHQGYGRDHGYGQMGNSYGYGGYGNAYGNGYGSYGHNNYGPDNYGHNTGYGYGNFNGYGQPANGYKSAGDYKTETYSTNKVY